jgi:cytidylate kinase-like protein
VGFSVVDVTCSVLCVSHTTGSDGDEIGRRVAEQLGYLYVDEDILARAAAQGGLDPGDVADEERRKTYARRILEELAKGGGDPVGLGATTGIEVVSPADIRALIRDSVVQTAARGDVVIVAHAAAHAIEPGPRTLRVLVTASTATRARRVAGAEQVDEGKAARTIKDSDAGRRDYPKRFYSVDSESSTDYDLVINTDVLSAEQAAEIILRAADR